MNPVETNPFTRNASKADLESSARFEPLFNRDGLIPAIVTDANGTDVLMFAWMNAEALKRTIETEVAHFWSRSRSKLWRKGKESGNELQVLELRTDCDQDVLWLRVEIAGNGVACHTGKRSCFYRTIRLGVTIKAHELIEMDFAEQTSNDG